jgi:F420H(2)-dependent biliverdin reductase
LVSDLDQDARTKLSQAKNIWVASVRPDGRPHITPVWFVWVEEKIYISLDPNSVKVRNISSNNRVSLALEDGLHPVICEGIANLVMSPLPVSVVQQFQVKYDWDLREETQYNRLFEITPRKWLSW